MMQMSRTKLIVTALVVLLAIVGWAMYGAIRSGYDRQEARFADERAQLTARIASLSGERDQLAARGTELEQTWRRSALRPATSRACASASTQPQAP